MKDLNDLELYNFESLGIKEKNSILQEIQLPDNRGSKIFLKREDLIHDKISGNKWRKLKYNLLYAKEKGYKTLLTFGGAYSNHIQATAYAGKLFGFKTIGIIRGEEHLPLNPTLLDALECGMEFEYVSRKVYREKNNEIFLNKFKDQYDDFYLIPEGGSNELAVKGCMEITSEIKEDYDYILSACGTGGTISGIICSLDGNKRVIGIPVLKGANFLVRDIKNLIHKFTGKLFTNWEINLNYHFGGYAKITKELIQFMVEFEKLNNILLDPVYTGKLLFGINDLIKNKYFPKGSKIIAIHTGGLQGIRGMHNKISKLL